MGEAVGQEWNGSRKIQGRSSVSVMSRLSRAFQYRRLF
jgi:hypothetical protein